MVNRDESTPSGPLEERSKAVFDASLDDIDGHTRSALTQARHAALAEIEHSKRSLMWRVWAPVSGVVAAAFVLLVMLAPLRYTPTSVEGSTMPFEDLDIVAETENLEMLENLEFYAWLDNAGAPSSDPAVGAR